eukprot:2466326-Amphidinium_carterae.1
MAHFTNDLNLSLDTPHDCCGMLVLKHCENSIVVDIAQMVEDWSDMLCCMDVPHDEDEEPSGRRKNGLAHMSYLMTCCTHRASGALPSIHGQSVYIVGQVWIGCALWLAFGHLNPVLPGAFDRNGQGATCVSHAT